MEETKLHDGWSSRKVIIGGVSFLLLAGIATAALFTGFADFGQWAGFIQWITPGILLPLFGAMAADRFAVAKLIAPK